MLSSNFVLAAQIDIAPSPSMKLEYKIKLNQKSEKAREAMAQKTLAAVKSRLSKFDLQSSSASIITAGKEKRLLINLQGSTQEIAKVKKMLPKKSSFSFKENISEDVLTPKWKATSLTNKYVTSVNSEKYSYSGENDQGHEGFRVSVKFNKKGALLFKNITARNIGKPLSIFIDGNLISSPIVNDMIIGGEAVIAGAFTEDEANELALKIGMNPLPTTLTLIK